MTTEVKEYGIPLWLLREYLEELWGKAEGEKQVIGDGWTATLSKSEPFKLGSLRISRVRLELEGDPDAIALLKPRLEVKTMRGGG